MPDALGAEGIAYNLDLPAGARLHLTGPVLARIFLGQLTRWNDPAITALNPGIALPAAPIAVVHRSDGSGTTYIFSSAGRDTAGERDRAGADEAWLVIVRRETFRAEQMRQPPLVEHAMGQQALALLRQLEAACASASDLEAATVESFNQHPDAGIITSFPGLGPLTGARVLAGTGDDRSRFNDARGLKAYAGAAPITRASGKSRSVTHRKLKNNRLASAGYTWTFSALTASPGARAHYDRRKDAGDRHSVAQRQPLQTACSAASTTAWQPASPTTKQPHSPPRPPRPPQPDNTNFRQPLDN